MCRSMSRAAAKGEMMARPKKHAEGLSRPVSFRLAEPDFQVYQEKVLASGLSASDFFRECVLTNKTQVVSRRKITADQKQLIYLVNKTSNNINQLAYRANSEHLAGKLSEQTFELILSNLEVISHSLKAAVNHAD
jgi:hypothetical protein